MNTPLAPGEPRSFGGGRFTVERRLGAGNFATVYLAHDERLDVHVAVKLLSDRWSWEPEVRGRFVQEARLLRSINDPLVVQIRDIAETEDGRPYLVMDYATEGTLEQRSIEMAQRGVRPTNEDLRVAARALAASLAVLHERRIAHRDIKPSNLLLTRSSPAGGLGFPPAHPSDTAIVRRGERMMLGDLGLAKDLAFDSGITVGVGTAGYMAPEQSLAGAKVDTRTDIYAASALLAQLASGEPPDPVRRVSNGRIETGRPLSPTVPQPLASALLRGLDSDPAARPQTVEQWLSDVETGLGAPPVAPVVMAPVARKSGRRRNAIIAAAALVVAGGIGVAIATGGDDGKPAKCTTASTTLCVELSGPTQIEAGKQAIWSVVAPQAVSGKWTLTGPVKADPDEWSPGAHFQGIWNVTGTNTLTLTVVDKDGNEASDSITFTVS